MKLKLAQGWDVVEIPDDENGPDFIRAMVRSCAADDLSWLLSAMHSVEPINPGFVGRMFKRYPLPESNRILDQIDRTVKERAKGADGGWGVWKLFLVRWWEQPHTSSLVHTLLQALFLELTLVRKIYDPPTQRFCPLCSGPVRREE